MRKFNILLLYIINKKNVNKFQLNHDINIQKLTLLHMLSLVRHIVVIHNEDI